MARILKGTVAPSSPFGQLAPDDGDFRISIAGAQEKTALTWHQGQWCRPLGATPTTHIFKLPLGLVGNRQSDMRTSVENEWLCAQLLAAFGLPVAACNIQSFDEQKVLVVGNRSLSGVLPPPGLTRKNPPPIQSGGTRSEQRDDKQQQAAAA